MTDLPWDFVVLGVPKSVQARASSIQRWKEQVWAAAWEFWPPGEAPLDHKVQIHVTAPHLARAALSRSRCHSHRVAIFGHYPDMGQLAAFCVVANVAEETASGEGGLEVRAGARHFPPGAKMWVLPPHWGDGGNQVIVAGHHRGTGGRRGLARMVMPRRHLTGFRV